MANTYTQIHYRQSHSVSDGTAGRGVILISTNIPSLTGRRDAVEINRNQTTSYRPFRDEMLVEMKGNHTTSTVPLGTKCVCPA